MPGWTIEEALMRIREKAVEIGHEPHTTDMGGNVGAYVRLFGTWETAKEIAGVKNYTPPPKPAPPMAERTYKYQLSPEELAEEKRLYEERMKARRALEPEHVRIPFVMTSHVGRASRKGRDNEYLPSRDAVEVALSAHR